MAMVAILEVEKGSYELIAWLRGEFLALEQIRGHAADRRKPA
jgi:hypothetical protein